MDELVRRCCFAGTEEEHQAREKAAGREKHSHLHATAAEIRARTAAMVLAEQVEDRRCAAGYAAFLQADAEYAAAARVQQEDTTAEKKRVQQVKMNARKYIEAAGGRVRWEEQCGCEEERCSRLRSEISLLALSTYGP